MSKIEIVAVPSGKAPEHIRKQWLGVRIPVLERECECSGYVRGALGGPPDKENRDGYTVSLSDAIVALRKAGRTEAADWWGNNPFTSSLIAPKLVFGKKFCKYIP